MMPRTLSLSLVFLVHLLAVTEADARLMGVTDPGCSHTQNRDPYETPTRVVESAGREANFPYELLYVGQCIDTDRFRPAMILNNPESDPVIRFANYRHNNEYWVATLNKKAKIEAVYFQIVMFEVVSGVTAAHTQFRVRFAAETPLQLQSLDGGETLMVGDLVVSYEASRPKDPSDPSGGPFPYNFALGGFENYLSVARVMSGRQRQYESSSNSTEQFELLIPEEERMLMVEMALKQSSRELFSRAYNTLIPNCTTEVFHLIDQLPSQQSVQADPFLTVLSSNPVAGPSLLALEERGILGDRFVTLADEVVMGITEGVAVTPEVPVESPFLVNLEESPYSIVMAINQRAGDVQLQKRAQQMAYEVIPEFVQKMGSSLMLGGSGASFSILGALDAMGPILKAKLQEVNDDLSEEPVQVSVYLTPWQGQGEWVDPMRELQIPIRLPYDTYQTDFSQVSSMTEGLYQVIAERSRKGESFGLAAVAAHFSLVRDLSSVKLQALGHLGALNQKLPEPVDTPQALIERVVIPNYHRAGQGTMAPFLEPMALLELSQSYTADNPEFAIDFGPFRGLSQRGPRLGLIELQTPESNWSCNRESYGTPRLEGWLALPLKGLDQLGRILDSSLHITHVDFDLLQRRVSKATVNVRAIPILCLQDNADATAQVTEALNAELVKVEASAAEQGVSTAQSIIQMIFNNNEEGAVSTFAE